MSGQHVIIDGYNLLHAHPSYAPGPGADLDALRARLVADLAGFAQGGPRTIVVFDGGGNTASDGAPHHLGALTIIFSPYGMTADATIEALAQRFRERGERVLVVTSDNATRQTVLTGTVSVLSSAEFAADLVVESESVTAAGRGARRLAVAERISPDVSATLARWARGAAPTPPKD